MCLKLFKNDLKKNLWNNSILFGDEPTGGFKGVLFSYKCIQSSIEITESSTLAN